MFSYEEYQEQLALLVEELAFYLDENFPLATLLGEQSAIKARKLLTELEIKVHGLQAVDEFTFFFASDPDYLPAKCLKAETYLETIVKHYGLFEKLHDFTLTTLLQWLRRFDSIAPRANVSRDRYRKYRLLSLYQQLTAARLAASISPHFLHQVFLALGRLWSKPSRQEVEAYEADRKRLDEQLIRELIQQFNEAASKLKSALENNELLFVEQSYQFELVKESISQCSKNPHLHAQSLVEATEQVRALTASVSAYQEQRIADAKQLVKAFGFQKQMMPVSLNVFGQSYSLSPELVNCHMDKLQPLLRTLPKTVDIAHRAGGSLMPLVNTLTTVKEYLDELAQQEADTDAVELDAIDEKIKGLLERINRLRDTLSTYDTVWFKLRSTCLLMDLFGLLDEDTQARQQEFFQHIDVLYDPTKTELSAPVNPDESWRNYDKRYTAANGLTLSHIDQLEKNWRAVEAHYLGLQHRVHFCLSDAEEKLPRINISPQAGESETIQTLFEKCDSVNLLYQNRLYFALLCSWVEALEKHSFTEDNGCNKWAKSVSTRFKQLQYQCLTCREPAVLRRALIEVFTQSFSESHLRQISRHSSYGVTHWFRCYIVAPLVRVAQWFGLFSSARHAFFGNQEENMVRELMYQSRLGLISIRQCQQLTEPCFRQQLAFFGQKQNEYHVENTAQLELN